MEISFTCLFFFSCFALVRTVDIQTGMEPHEQMGWMENTMGRERAGFSSSVGTGMGHAVTMFMTFVMFYRREMRCDVMLASWQGNGMEWNGTD